MSANAKSPAAARAALGSFTCALFAFVVVASANASAPTEPHGFMFMRLIVAAVGILALLTGTAALGYSRSGPVRLVAMALPIAWLIVLLVSSRRALDWIGWFL